MMLPFGMNALRFDFGVEFDGESACVRVFGVECSSVPEINVHICDVRMCTSDAFRCIATRDCHKFRA